MNKHISNPEYLNLISSDKGAEVETAILPHEKQEVDKNHAKNISAFDRIVEEKVSVSGGDDWHDGAFRATDNEAKILVDRNASLVAFLGAVVVSYPEETELRASLGSRVTVTQNGFDFPVDIIGFRGGYPETVVDDESGEEVTPVTPESPLGNVILGHEVDYEATYNNGSRRMTVKINSISQTAIKSLFAPEYADNMLYDQE